MTDTELFQRFVVKKGLKYGYLARCLGISRASLWMKINNTSEFKASEIAALSELLNLTVYERDAIFFASEVS